MNDENAIYKNILTGNGNDKYEKKLNSHNDNSLMKYVKYVYGGISLGFYEKKTQDIDYKYVETKRRKIKKLKLIIFFFCLTY